MKILENVHAIMFYVLLTIVVVLVFVDIYNRFVTDNPNSVMDATTGEIELVTTLTAEDVTNITGDSVFITEAITWMEGIIEEPIPWAVELDERISEIEGIQSVNMKTIAINVKSIARLLELIDRMDVRIKALIDISGTTTAIEVPFDATNN